jgi:hypothetical protein
MVCACVCVCVCVCVCMYVREYLCERERVFPYWRVKRGFPVGVKAQGSSVALSP